MGSATIEKSIADAFSEPLPLSEMIRITFITGAGKLGRQKYDEGAAKAITSTLRDLGFDEDRGASAVLECAGTFKMQHDTGKNLKTVVVFPKVTGGGEGGINGMSLGETQTAPLLPDNSPEQKLAYSSINTFKRLIEGQCPSWNQKKGCVAALDSIKGLVQEVEAKLMAGTPLDDSEQVFYDSVSIGALEEKVTFVRELMHKQVDEGRISTAERRVLLDQVGKKLDGLSKDLATAQKDGKPERAIDKLKANIDKVEERKQKLQKISPQPPHPLKNEAAIGKLRKELAPLLQIEESGKGRLLTLKESQSIARKDEILEEIEQLEVCCSVPCRVVFAGQTNPCICRYRSPVWVGLRARRTSKIAWKQQGLRGRQRTRLRKRRQARRPLRPPPSGQPRHRGRELPLLVRKLAKQPNQRAEICLRR